MKKTLLLPHGFRRIGWIILIPTLLLGILMFIDDFNGVPTFFCPDVPMNVYDRGYILCHSETTTSVLNNIALIGIVLGSLFVACSRERVEDELIGHIRLDALLLALYVNIGVIIVAALAVYDIEFLNVMVYNLCSLPLLFLAIFRWKLWRLRKEASNEE